MGWDEILEGETRLNIKFYRDVKILFESKQVLKQKFRSLAKEFLHRQKTETKIINSRRNFVKTLPQTVYHY